MDVIRETSKYRLNKGTLQAEGLYNMEEKATDKITYWFDADEAKKLLRCKTDKGFDKKASEFEFYD